MRTLCLLAFGCLVGLFAYTYNLKLKTRSLDSEASALMTALQDESDFVALMRAEVSYLSRPERIEDMARKTLKLEPIASTQLVSWTAITPGQLPQASANAPAPRKDGIAALIAKTSTAGAFGGAR